MKNARYLAVICHPDDLERIRATVTDTVGLPAITSRLVARDTFVLHTDL